MEHDAQDYLEKLFPNTWREFNLLPVNPETGNRLSGRLVDFLKFRITQTAESVIISRTWPNVEYMEGKLLVRLWLNESDREKGFSARKLVKPGKAVKHIFPYLSDSEVESMVDEMRAELGERQYNLHTGTDCESFKFAYIGEQCRMENPCTTHGRKALANSCMRHESICHYDTEGNLRHPAEAYASGEFQIVYVTDRHNKVAARCVVWTSENENPVAAPIYGVCERSMNMVQEFLDSIGCEDNDWNGANLLAIEGRDGGYIAPYLDNFPRSLDTTGTGFLVVKEMGELDANDYSGLLGAGQDECERCGRGYDAEDEGGIVDEMPVCDGCLENSNFCEHTDESTFEDVFTVHMRVRGGYIEEQWRESSVDNEAIRIRGEYWREDDVEFDYNGDPITPKEIDGGEYFLSDWSGDYYPANLMAETEDGEIVSTLEIEEDHRIWEQGANGVWFDVQPDMLKEKELA